MSTTAPTPVEFYRYGILALVLAGIGVFFGLLLGIDFLAIAGLVLDGILVGAVLAFVYLFYRFVRAVEEIAEKL